MDVALVRVRSCPPKQHRRAFTLTELLVAIAVMGILMSLLLVAVQAARETARRAKCANNMRNHVLALEQFTAAHQRFPAGRQYSVRTKDYAWSYEVLPYLEQEALFAQFNRARPWSDPSGNMALAETMLPVFRCPSAVQKFPGKTDYAGIMGSLLTGLPIRGEQADGVLIEVGTERRQSVRPGEITDGASHTILVAECGDRAADNGGRWVSGFNCISHDNGRINEIKGGGAINSPHPSGAYVGFADGRVEFLTNSTDQYVVGAICTRGGGDSSAPY